MFAKIACIKSFFPSRNVYKYEMISNIKKKKIGVKAYNFNILSFII